MKRKTVKRKRATKPKADVCMELCLGLDDLVIRLNEKHGIGIDTLNCFLSAVVGNRAIDVMGRKNYDKLLKTVREGGYQL
jgi:hypothetical protein